MASAPLTLSIVNPLPELQKAFCLFQMGGDVWLGDRTEIADTLAGRRSGEVNMYRLAAGKLIMERFLETLPVASDLKNVVKQFITSPNSTVYNEVAFSPQPTPAATLNYWVGSLVQPHPGDWSVIDVTPNLHPVPIRASASLLPTWAGEARGCVA